MFPTKEIEDKVIALSENEDKAGLDEYAASLGIKLDKRKSFDNMTEAFAQKLKDQPKESSSSTEETETKTEAEDEQETESTDTVTDDESTDSDENVAVNAELEEATDVKVGDTVEPVGDTEASDEQETDVETKETEFSFDENFKPAFGLTFTDRRHGGDYANVGYWIIDELQKNRVIERFWSQEAIDECKHSREIATILFYVNKHGKVTLRESRNSRFYRISKTGAKVAG